MAVAIKPLRRRRRTAQRGKPMSQSQRWGKVVTMIDRPPEYGMTCHCGMRITGTNEKGLVSLFKKHYDTGEYHLAYELHQNHYSYRKSEQEIVIEKAILRREKKMPVPEGEITTSEILETEVVPVEDEDDD